MEAVGSGAARSQLRSESPAACHSSVPSASRHTEKPGRTATPRRGTTPSHPECRCVATPSSHLIYSAYFASLSAALLTDAAFLRQPARLPLPAHSLWAQSPMSAAQLPPAASLRPEAERASHSPPEATRAAQSVPWHGRSEF